jgi:hypothetical protein
MRPRQRDSPILHRSSLGLGRPDADECSREEQMEQSEGKAEPVDSQQTVALAAGAVHLDPVPAELLDLPYRNVGAGEVGEHG